MVGLEKKESRDECSRETTRCLSRGGPYYGGADSSARGSGASRVDHSKVLRRLRTYSAITDGRTIPDDSHGAARPARSDARRAGSGRAHVSWRNLYRRIQ